MDGSIRLSGGDRKSLLFACQRGPTVAVSRRAHIVLLLADGRSWRDIRSVAFVSFGLIRDCLTRWRIGGVAAIIREAPQSEKRASWLEKVVGWLTQKTPQDFGFFRSRWSCETLAETLAWETGIHLSAETMRRALRSNGWVWRRPRPVVGPADPDYQPKLRRIRRLLAGLHADETAVFEDEVDVHLNPKIGNCWMPKGKQAEVVTPGNNEKRRVAGSLHWRTGRLLASRPQRRRNTNLFLSHLDDLRRRLRGFQRTNDMKRAIAALYIVCCLGLAARSDDHTPDESLYGVWEEVLPPDVAAKRPVEARLRLVVAGDWQGNFRGEQRISASRIKVEPRQTPRRLSLVDADGKPMRQRDVQPSWETAIWYGISGAESAAKGWERRSAGGWRSYV